MKLKFQSINSVGILPLWFIHIPPGAASAQGQLRSAAATEAGRTDQLDLLRKSSTNLGSTVI